MEETIAVEEEKVEEEAVAAVVEEEVKAGPTKDEQLEALRVEVAKREAR